MAGLVRGSVDRRKARLRHNLPGGAGPRCARGRRRSSRRRAAAREGRRRRPQPRASMEGPVGFQRKEIVATLAAGHLLRGLGLGVHRVAGHQRARRARGSRAAPGRRGSRSRPRPPPPARWRRAPRRRRRLPGAGPSVPPPGRRSAAASFRRSPARRPPSAPRSSRKASNPRANASGSSRRKTRLKVSWLGKPFSRRRNSLSSASRSSANSAKSTQLSAPQTDATNAIARMSSSSCRRALPRRGSGISRCISIRTPSVPPSGPTAKSRSARKGSAISQMRFPCAGSCSVG